ncbi:hypothetical protein M9Y10_001961 [Tritrichomonas musculus]|uniref:Protein kinase domain-containing protein n=1 Tax=Tritrichomonas musculus TaxID=1915356 RepID=A0ABR2L8K5_9EUKA
MTKNLRIIRNLSKKDKSSVDLCQNVSTGRVFVVKTVELSLEHEIDIKRIELIRTARHPSVLSSLPDNEIYHSNNQIKLSFPYYPKGSLDSIISDASKGIISSKLDPTSKSIIAYGIAQSMVFLHKNNFIHCLLNPSHILLSAQYYPLVSGFWYSNICDIKEYILKEKKESMLFSSPELFQLNSDNDSSITPKADVFSFGMILLSLYTCQINFIRTPNALLIDLISKDDAPLLHNIISKCVILESSKRASFDEIIEILNSSNQLFPGTDESKYAEYKSYFMKEIIFPPLPEKLSPIGEFLDVKDVFEVYKSASENKNNPFAQLLCAIYRRNGAGCTTNKKASQKAYKNAGDFGLTEGQFNYGLMINQNPKNAQIRKEALRYIINSANGGRVESQVHLAKMILNNQVPGSNLGAANHYLSSASYNGSLEATKMLVDIYSSSTSDKEKKILFLKKAADMGDGDSQFNYAQYLISRNQSSILSSPSNSKIKTVTLTKSSSNFTSSAISTSNSASNKKKKNVTNEITFNIDLNADSETGINNIKEAIPYLRAAANNCNTFACRVLATIYNEFPNIKLPLSPGEISYILKTAASMGDEKSRNAYANLLFNEKIAILSEDEMIQSTKIAADSGNLKAIILYGQMLLSGDRVPRDPNAAAKYFKIAADAPYFSAEAQFRYAKCLINNFESCNQAVAYLEKAAKQQHVKAEFMFSKYQLAFLGAPDQVTSITKMDVNLPMNMATLEEENEQNIQNQQMMPNQVSPNGGPIETTVDARLIIRYLLHALRNGCKKAKGLLGLLVFQGLISKEYKYSNDESDINLGVLSKEDGLKMLKDTAFETKSSFLLRMYAENVKNASPEEAVKAYFELSKTASKFHLYHAYINLGMAYKDGNGIQKDKKQAVSYFMKCLELNPTNQRSAICVIDMYHEDDSHLADYSDEETAAMIKKCAETNYPPALEVLSDLYRFGKGVNKNIFEANKYKERAAQIMELEDEYDNEEDDFEPPPQQTYNPSSLSMQEDEDFIPID